MVTTAEEVLNQPNLFINEDTIVECNEDSFEQPDPAGSNDEHVHRRDAIHCTKPVVAATGHQQTWVSPPARHIRWLRLCLFEMALFRKLRGCNRVSWRFATHD